MTAQDMRAIHTDDAPAAVGPYSQAVKTTGGLVFISGQIPLDPATGALVEGGIAAQTERVLINLAAIARAASGDLAHAVKTTVFLADISDFEAVNAIYARYFTGPVLPARAAIQIGALPKGALIEIEAVLQV